MLKMRPRITSTNPTITSIVESVKFTLDSHFRVKNLGATEMPSEAIKTAFCRSVVTAELKTFSVIVCDRQRSDPLGEM